MGLVLAKLWSFFGNEGEFYSIKKNTHTLGLELLKSGLCMSLNLVSCEKKKDVASFNEVFGRFTYLQKGIICMASLHCTVCNDVTFLLALYKNMKN